MGRTYEVIDQALSEWLTAQPVFFVATAPLSGDGLVNCSPKGNRDEFVVVDERTVAYLDQTGSGVETIAHLRENGRIVVMFCAFAGAPRIVRLHGRGRAVLTDDPSFSGLARRFPVGTGSRSCRSRGTDRRWTSGRIGRARKVSGTTGPRRTRRASISWRASRPTDGGVGDPSSRTAPSRRRDGDISETPN
jgi:hypothetical protein